MQTPPSKRRARIALVVAAAIAAGPAFAVDPQSGVVFSAGVGGGAELGLEGLQAGVAESELSLGWQHEASGIRPELAMGIGLAPDGHFAVRPGLRWVAPEQPIQLRVAFDWSNARDKRRWRWLMIGGAFELRWTSSFSLFTGLDLGFPLGVRAGLPLLIRGGAAFRF